MRDARHSPWCGVASALLGAGACVVFSAGCATDDLDRLGAGRKSISAGPQSGGDAQLGDPLRPDSALGDAGLPQPSAADAGAAPVEIPELLPNPSFESGHEGWEGFGDSHILDVAVAHRGSRAILSTNRTASWQGPLYDIRSLVVPGQPYGVSVWVRNELGTHNIMLTLKTECDADIEYTRLATRAVAREWLQLDASFMAPDCAGLQELSVYVEGPPAYRNILVDDVSLRAISLGG